MSTPKLCNKEGIYYYYGKPCQEITCQKYKGNIVDHYGSRWGSFNIYDTGYIVGETLGGTICLKVKEA